jgi:gas vesicle protein
VSGVASIFSTPNPTNACHKLAGQGENMMDNEDQELQENQEPRYHTSTTLGVLLGVLIGGLAGALTMLLLAPQSGEDTRTQIQKKSLELRDRTTGMMQDAVGQMRLDGTRIAVGGRQKAEELLQQGQAAVAQQLGRVSKAAQAGKKAIESS